jgi:predicted porin
VRRSFLIWFAITAFGVLSALTGAARAADLRIGNAAVVAAADPSPLISTLTVDSFVTGAPPGYGPGFGMVTMTLPSSAPAAAGGASALAGNVYSTGGEYSAQLSQLSGSDIGVFGSRAERSSIFNGMPGAAWNLGGSLGYGGFYLRAGLSATPALGPVQGTQGWQAGFGFATGALDLRLMYLTAAQNGTVGTSELDSQQWTLGGIYNLSSRLRLNADAFYGLRDSRAASLYTAQPAAGTQAPQGTGARLGVQLRF